MEIARDAYSVLQVDPAADDVVIHAAFRALARHLHPDGDAPNHWRMAELNAAYGMVRDPQRRRDYDASRRMAHLHPVPIVDGSRRVEVGAPRSEPDGRHTVLDFGRYAGWSVQALARHDPDYLRWLCRHSSGLRFRDAIFRVLPREPDLDRRSNSVA